MNCRILKGSLAVTASNISLVKEQSVIFSAIKSKLSDFELDARVRHRLSDALQANDYVRKIQRMGVKVIVAAGNNGAERFSLDFLSAHKRLAALDADGKLTDFSALGNGAGQGRYRVMYRAPDLFSSSPIATDKGHYWLEGTKVRYVASLLEGAPPVSYEGFLGPQSSLRKPDLIDSRKLDSQPLSLGDKYTFLENLNGTSFANIDWYKRNLSVKR